MTTNDKLLDEVTEERISTFKILWEEYALCDDEKLDESAKSLKYILLNIVNLTDTMRENERLREAILTYADHVGNQEGIDFLGWHVKPEFMNPQQFEILSMVAQMVKAHRNKQSGANILNNTFNSSCGAPATGDGVALNSMSMEEAWKKHGNQIKDSDK